MSTTELNIQIWKNIAEIADDEKLMTQLKNYLKKLVTKKHDDTLMTKKEFFTKLDEAEAEYKRGEFTTLLPGESISDMLKRCGYAI